MTSDFWVNLVKCLSSKHFWFPYREPNDLEKLFPNHLSNGENTKNLN